MAIPVLMPKQGQSVETCIITKWFKKKGDTIRIGDILFSYETDKAAFDVESPADGTLLEIFYGDGTEVPVLVNVAVIGNAGEPTESYFPGKSGKSDQSSSEQKPLEEKKEPTAVKETNILPSKDLSKIRISPRARQMAKIKGISYDSLTGTGPNGRIICSDVEKVFSVSAAIKPSLSADESEFSEQPLSNVRKLISKAMYSSLQNSAQLTHHMSADVRKILEARKKIKEGIAAGTEKQDITLNDMVCWCVIRALEKYPEINSHLIEDKIRTFNRVNLGFAVDTQRGLMVPSVKNADGMNLSGLSRELKSAAEACKKGNINPELIQSSSASFTVSNLGNYGVEMFTPVINLPQTAILGVCTIIYRPADLGNNTFGFVPYIGLSLTYDHRAIDGGPATRFLHEIKEQIEKFSY